MSVFVLKIIAVICMAIDHIRYIDPICDNTYTKILGRIAFPIFAFFIAEGYIHTKDIKKYLKRLAFFAVISQIPFLLFVWGCNITNEFELNVIFTLFCGAISILSFDKLKNPFLKFLCIVFLAFLAEFLNMDYGALGVLIILSFYIFRNKNLLKIMILVIAFIVKLILQCKFNIDNIIYCEPYFIGYIISGILLYFYSGELGKYKLKYFFYYFYPVHMTLIYCIYTLIN